jgi:hypothetical protein
VRQTSKTKFALLALLQARSAFLINASTLFIRMVVKHTCSEYKREHDLIRIKQDQYWRVVGRLPHSTDESKNWWALVEA